MGKTFSTGLLTDGISQDSSNNIGIGVAPSGTNKFEVSGSTKLNGNTAITGSLSVTAGITGSFQGTATTASYVLNAVSASYAPDTTFPYSGSAQITGSLGVTGSVGFAAYLTSGPAAWSVGGSLITGRCGLAGAGTNIAALAFGGANPTVLSCTETYNGTSWSGVTGMISARYYVAGVGATNTSALAFGGANPTILTCTETYNGSSWSSGGAMITARATLAGAGTNTAALAFGGYTPGVVTCTETYNGSAWSSVNALITARQYIAGAGATNTSALAFGGFSGVALSCTETYNGTSWSAGGALINARAGLAGAGTNTATLAFGGIAPPATLSCTEAYNGSSWTAGGAMITVRYFLAGDGTNTAALAFGGNAPSGFVACTETYNSSTALTKTFDYSNTTGQLSATGSLFGTASFATTAVTASFANAFTVAGTLTATTLVVQTITSSVLYSSGSNVFGNSLANTQNLTGSVGITGSLAINGITNIGARSGGSIRNLNIYGATNANAIIKIDGADGNGYGAQIDFVSKQTGGTSNIWTLGTGINGGTNAFELYNGSTTPLSINLSGSVGIGTTSPNDILTISRNAADNAGGLTLYNANTSGYGSAVTFRVNYAGVYNTSRIHGDWDTGNAGALHFYTANTSQTLVERMTITGGGNVGIGITNPNSNLEVYAGTGSVFRAVFSSTNVIEIGNYKPTGTGGAGYQQLDVVGSILSFQTGTAGGGSSTERMRITSGGSINFSGTDATTQYYFGYNRPTATNLLVNGGNNNKIRIQNSESDIVVLNSNGNSYFNGGNVGIGTTSPSELLDVRNSYREPTSGEFTQILASTTTQDAGRGGSLGFGGFTNGTSGYTTFSGIKGFKENGDGGNTAGTLAFYTRVNSGAITERMRIASGGDVVVKGSLADLTLGSSGAEVFFGRNSSNYITANGGGGAEIRIISNTNGVVLSNGGTSWGSLSDENSKDIIEPIVNACYNLSQVRTVIGKYKTDNGDKRRLFLIAQDIEKIYPEAVFNIENENEEESLGLNYQDLIPVLVKAIQELSAKNESLQSQINELKNN